MDEQLNNSIFRDVDLDSFCVEVVRERDITGDNARVYTVEHPTKQDYLDHVATRAEEQDTEYYVLYAQTMETMF